MKVAVVLFNLGGPDSLDSVRPFLFNLFNDPLIIRIPGFIRTPLAAFIAWRREKKARGIYAQIGGGSPLRANTEKQARVLEKALVDIGDVRCFVAMRYWHPMSAETVREIADFAPDKILLLPLYPQYSTTTTLSSLRAFRHAARKKNLSAPINVIGCYPDESGFIAALAESTRSAYAQAASYGAPRILMSAHGLPEKIVQQGDPYQWQCEKTSAALIQALGIDNIDAVTCYQSRVGPLRWIGPATEDEIRRAGRDKVPVVVVPIAFVSEHSETLVELDIEYRALAHESGVPFYARASTVSVMPDFIEGLARLTRAALKREKTDKRCPLSYNCLCRDGDGNKSL